MTDRHAPSLPPAYRVFRLDFRGHVAGPTVGIDAPTDEGAIGQARRLAGWTGIELWNGGRLVVWLPPTIGTDFI